VHCSRSRTTLRFFTAVKDAGGSPDGWYIPEWSPEGEQQLRDTYGVKTVMLSLPVPGPPVQKGQDGAKIARMANDFCAKLRDAEPSKFGILAAVPSLLEKDLVLQELDYAYDVCKTDGITLFSRYGDGHKYLGHPDFDYLWEALNKREAVVHVHPTHTTFLEWFNKNTPQPLVDFPLETTKAALDLVINGHMRRYPKVKIILSHGGGTLPYLISRTASTLGCMRPEAFDTDQMIEDAKKFYFDVAVTGHEIPLSLLQDFAQPDHILFGSDYPYAPWSIIDYHIKGLDKFEFKNPDLKQNIANKNALKLFPRLQQYYK
jgi:predicted TIM-barrel fold metal-dependent hydrolase